MHAPYKSPDWVQEIIFNDLIEYMDRMLVHMLSIREAEAVIYSGPVVMMRYQLTRDDMSSRRV